MNDDEAADRFIDKLEEENQALTERLAVAQVELTALDIAANDAAVESLERIEELEKAVTELNARISRADSVLQTFGVTLRGYFSL